MKTTGVSCETKFRLLVFLGHPSGHLKKLFGHLVGVLGHFQGCLIINRSFLMGCLVLFCGSEEKGILLTHPFEK